MVKLQIRYKTDLEKNRVIAILSAATKIKKISKPSKSGQYYRVYLDVE